MYGQALVLDRVETLAHEVFVERVAIGHPTVAHRTGRAFFPIGHVQASFHVDDGGPDARSCLGTVNRGESFGHERGSAYSFDDRRAPANKMENRFFHVQNTGWG